MSAYVLIILLIFIAVFMMYVYAQWKLKNNERYFGYIRVRKLGGVFHMSHQQDDVYNISSRVQGQEPQWPTHDAYLSIEHINISNQLNKPSYDAPPSYDEAMRIAALNSSSGSSAVPTVVVVPKTTN